MERLGRCLTFATIFVAMLASAGCNTNPAYVKEGFNPTQMDRVVVLPMIDNRANPNPKHDFEQMKLAAYVGTIRAMRYVAGYRAISTSDIGQVGSYMADRLPRFEKDSNVPKVDVDWVRRLGPKDAHWVAVPVMENISSHYVVLHAGGNAEMSLYIFDRRSGELVWHDRMSAAIGGAGLLDAAIVALSKPEADAVRGVSVAIVKRLKKKEEPYQLVD